MARDGKSSRRRRKRRNRVVDVSTARKWFIKHWEIMRQLVEGEVEGLGTNRYKLSPRFHELFSNMHSEVIFEWVGGPTWSPADFEAWALCEAAQVYGKRRADVPPSTENLELWPRTRPISDAWTRFGSPPPGILTGRLLEDPGPGQELKPLQPGPLKHPRIRIDIKGGFDKSALPKMEIELQGEPVCILLSVMAQSVSRRDRNTARKEARRVWRGLLKTLSVLLRVAEAKGGRPLEGLMNRAAYLREFYGLTWRLIAERLCEEKHVHTEKCKERFRRGVDQYWKRVRRQARTMPPGFDIVDLLLSPDENLAANAPVADFVIGGN